SVKRPDAEDVALQAEPRPGDVTVTANTVADTRAVGADAAASQEIDPEAESRRPDAGPAKEPEHADADPMPATNPAAETEPLDAANTDPDTRG
ncbi:MAG: hypothetical protein ACJ72A_03635, partial [Nocardioidaceae bacterium]